MTRLPGHIALAEWAHPLGPRPEPSAADWQAGRRFFAEHYEADPNVSRKWIEGNRGKAIRQLAMLEMAKRLSARKMGVAGQTDERDAA